MQFKIFFVITFMMAFCAAAQENSDPFLWLEAVDGEKAIAWVKAQNSRTLSILEKEPEFTTLNQEILSILNAKERIPYPTIRGKYLYNFWQDQTHVRGLYRRTTLKDYLKGNPDWEPVLDIDELCKKENENWVFKGAQFLYPDFKRCLVSLSRGGSDAVEIREFDAVNRQFVKDGFYVPSAKNNVSWIDLNTLYIGSDFGEGSMTTSGYPRICKIWRRGTPLSAAETVFAGEPTDMSVRGSVYNTPKRQYHLFGRHISFYRARYFALEKGRQIPLEIPEDAEIATIFKNQLLLLLKSDWNLGSRTLKQGGLYAIDYDKFLGGDRGFTAVLEPDARSSISAVTDSKNYVLVTMLRNVREELHRFKWARGQWQRERIDVPDFGQISVTATEEGSDRLFFTYSSFLNPATLYYSSNAGKSFKPVRSLKAFYDGDNYQTGQYEAVSRDGAKIPYFIVHARDMTANGANPTLLYGYGGFEVSETPYYLDRAGVAWLEKGGVYVLANIRGGGEFGPKWHQAALKENRQRAYDDFIAIAEDLIARKITSPRHLGVMGGSNGGLLVGVMLTQRPDLFNAVVCQVPLLDMFRYNKLLAGASWMAEYGNPDIPGEWAYIQKYSPYQNLRADVKYPTPLFTTTTRDDRVHPGHARKMAAKMESMGHPFFYYENMEGGHGSGCTNAQRAFMNTLEYIYLWKMLR